MKLRQLTDKGRKAFEDYLARLEEENEFVEPEIDFNNPSYSKKFQPEIEIDTEKQFETGLELGEYLEQTISSENVERADIVDETGIWSWLTIQWLDQLIEEKEEGLKLRKDYYYICSTDWNRYYRHYVAIAYYIHSKHGAEKSKLFLESPPYRHGEFVEQFASRQHIINDSTVIQAIYNLYWNEVEDKPKRGTRSKDKPGTARRIGKFVNQIILTYDIHSMGDRRLLEIFPQEYDRWKENEDEENEEQSSDDQNKSLRQKLGF